MALSIWRRLKFAFGPFRNHKSGTIIPKETAIVAVDSAIAVAIGDFIWHNTDDGRPFSDLSDAGTKAQNQEAAHDAFLGIALEAHAAGSGNSDILVATRGYCINRACVSGTYEVGEFVGPKGTGASDAVGVSNDTVESVATGNLAVGRVMKRGTTVTTLCYTFESTVVYGGPQAMID